MRLSVEKWLEQRPGAAGSHRKRTLEVPVTQLSSYSYISFIHGRAIVNAYLWLRDYYLSIIRRAVAAQRLTGAGSRERRSIGFVWGCEAAENWIGSMLLRLEQRTQIRRLLETRSCGRGDCALDIHFAN